MHLDSKTILTQQESGIKPLDSDFIPNEFRVLVESHGYEVIYERALMCPCKDRGSDHLTTCRNCGGTGHLFVNPTRMKVLLTSINHDREYEEYGKQDLGMLYATPVALVKLTQMDRLTILDGESAHSEVIYPEKDDVTGNYFSLVHYYIKSVEWVGLFIDTDLKVQKLELNEDYTYQNNKIILDDKFNSLEDPQVSITYMHHPQFHVWDIANDIRSVKGKKEGGGRKTNYMPMKALVKRAHLIEDSENFEGTRLYDNSWLNLGNMSCKTIDELSQQERVIRYTDPQKIFNTMTNLQRIQMKGLSGRVMDVESITLTHLAPTISIA